MRCKNLDLQQDRGVAGLTLLLSLVVFLFVIGLLVMIFSLMGGELKDSSTVKWGVTSGTETQNGAGINNLSDSGASLTTCASKNNGRINTISMVVANGTTLTPTTDYTYSVCTYTHTLGSSYNNTEVNVTYTFDYSGDAWDSMNNTVTGIANTTDWFEIFIVIGAMVVLILLTVIIIVAIRGSGLIAEGGSSENGNIGSP